MDRRKKFIEKAIKRHGEKYDYSKVEYVGSQSKVCIICPEHGEFWQEPAAHVRGNGCPICANLKRGDTFRSNLDEFIKRAKKVHGDKYDYSLVKYVNAETKVCIICHEHGKFYITPQHHIIGQGCPKCAGRGLSTEDIIKKFISVHGDKYDYSKVVYKKMNEKVCIICPEHGEFWQTPGKHINGQGCPRCAKLSAAKKNNIGVEEFIKRSEEKWGKKYDYSKVDYKKMSEKVEIICPKHGSFFQRPYDHLNGHGCPVCGKLESKDEIELYEFICHLVGKDNVIHNDRKILDGKEIDILIPEYNIGFEYNGLRWHCESYDKDRYYHLNKTLLAGKKGIRLVHIFEDEWVNNKEIVMNYVKTILGKNADNKIMAEDCYVKEIDTDLAKAFLKKNHIQGFASASVHVGCFKDDLLIGVMSFLKEDGVMWNLNRFATDINYTCDGILDKMFKWFLEKYGTVLIKSFADKRWQFNESDTIYNSLGFKYVNDVKPDYRYVQTSNPIKRINKVNFRKNMLANKYNFSKEMTELEMANQLGYERIWDCGSLRYEYSNKE